MRGIALDEAELIRRARGGDADAYGDPVRVHQAAAWRLAVLIAGEAYAQDITQTAVVKAPPLPVRTWHPRRIHDCSRQQAARKIVDVALAVSPPEAAC